MAHAVYRSKTPHRLGLTRLAYRLLDSGDWKNGEQLLAAAREIISMTLSGNVPKASVLRSLDLFLADQKIFYCNEQRATKGAK
jgi:hypothetical protein